VKIFRLHQLLLGGVKL